MLRQIRLASTVVAAAALVFAFAAPAFAQTGMAVPSSSSGQPATPSSSSQAAAQQKAVPPLSRASWQRLQQNPQALAELMARMPAVTTSVGPVTKTSAIVSPTSGTWSTVANTAGNFSLTNPLLLTDGTVIVQALCTNNWYKLTPNINGSYAAGTWSQIASMPSGYNPLFFSSAVLTDGKVIVEGGEYNSGTNGNCGGGVWTAKGAIYDPVANSWTAVTHPSGWSQIGDSQGIVLTNGTYLQADCCDYPPARAALFTESSLSWTATGSGKADGYDEEGWTLLPNGNVLTVDAYWPPGSGCGTNSEIYNAGTGTWSTAGSTVVQLPDCNGTGDNGGPSYEMGPQVLRPDGTVVAFGAIVGNGTGSTPDPTAIYNSATGSWTQGPNVPAVREVNYTLADAPAALLPNGNILFAACPGLFNSPTQFFELSAANSMAAVNNAAGAASVPCFEYNFLVLPTGQILAVADQTGNAVNLYTPSGGTCGGCAPVITSLSSTTLGLGQSYQIGGNQLNGLSQGAAYGDDVQAATNYPLVQIVNNATGHVFYAKTSGFSTTSVAVNQASTANFTVPAGAETGPSTLYAVANGNPSAGVGVNIGSTVYTLSVSDIGGGLVTSSPGGISCGNGGNCSANYTPGTQVTLSQTPATNWFFLEWDNACTGNGGCVVTMNGNESVISTWWITGGN